MVPEVDVEKLKGRIAVKVFNPAAKCQTEQHEWCEIEVVEVDEDNVIHAVTDGPDDMHLETINRHFIVDYLTLD